MAYKILVVDDDLAILRLIKKVLEYEKYEVVIRNKIEEIDLCDFTGFDLILLDIMMPVSGLRNLSDDSRADNCSYLFYNCQGYG